MAKILTEDWPLHRLAFGPDPVSREALQRLGFRAWVEEQLAPGADSDCERRLAALRLPIRYGADPEKGGPVVDEQRPLQWLQAPIESLWALHGGEGRPVAPAEKARPRNEAIAATLVRAVYSPWQLREVLADFWHDHFNVNAWDQTVGIAFPVYQREAIRPHCLGNFRAMLGAVARSAAMLRYLNNSSSRAGAPNENYARELLELHTLGRDAYLNGLYQRWREVPGALQGHPQGYIDQDVYEAARALTGWTLEDGAHLGGGQTQPRTGRFAYVEAWHDNYQKRVLARDFDPYQPPLADGEEVLDLAAFHPATAQHLAHKLCVRLVDDRPRPALVAGAARVWRETARRPDQIARVVEYILLSRDFAASRQAKVKRPLELVAGFVRATGLNFQPTEGLVGEMAAAGQRLYGWPTPDGHPDDSAYWLSSNAIRRRWTLVAGLGENWWGNGPWNPFPEPLSLGVAAGRFVAFWLDRLYGANPPPLAERLLATAGLRAGQALTAPGPARHLVAWAAMVPEYQLR